MVPGIPSPEHKVSGIPNLDLRIPGSHQKSEIPVCATEVVQHCTGPCHFQATEGWVDGSESERSKSVVGSGGRRGEINMGLNRHRCTPMHIFREGMQKVVGLPCEVFLESSRIDVTDSYQSANRSKHKKIRELSCAPNGNRTLELVNMTENSYPETIDRWVLVMAFCRN